MPLVISTFNKFAFNLNKLSNCTLKKLINCLLEATIHLFKVLANRMCACWLTLATSSNYFIYLKLNYSYQGKAIHATSAECPKCHDNFGEHTHTITKRVELRGRLTDVRCTAHAPKAFNWGLLKRRHAETVASPKETTNAGFGLNG